MSQIEQQYLNELDAKLWKSADKLLASMDAANYKHVVLSLIFLKYVSDNFVNFQQDLKRYFKDPEHLYYINPAFYDSDEEYQHALADAFEERDYYTAENVFWVPKDAHYATRCGASISKCVL